MDLGLESMLTGVRDPLLGTDIFELKPQQQQQQPQREKTMKIKSTFIINMNRTLLALTISL